MKRILEFLKTNKYAIIWTVCYVAVMWAILAGLFGFDMFSGADWSKLMRAHLRGFPGLVFGILILAALPLYVATMVLVVRNKAPLLTVPIPDAVKVAAKKLVPAKKPASAPVAETKKAEETVAEAAPKSDFPDNLPSELRGAFVRARQHIGRTPTSNFDTSKMVNSAAVAAQMPELMPVGVGTVAAGGAATSAVTDTMADEIPLPTDFDFDADEDSFVDNAFSGGAPMFKDIDFSDAPADEDVAPVVTATKSSSVQEFLTAHNIVGQIGEDGLVRTSDMVIATHDDAAFWVADNDAWFATGAQKPSPVAALKAAATDGVRPVLYLAETNIMDIDALRAAWTADGILVIDNLDALPI